MNELPNEVLRLVLWEAREYTPALRGVCRRWHELVVTQREHFRRRAGVTVEASLDELALRGHAGLIRWIAAERRGDTAFSAAELNEMLAGAARGGHLEFCRQLHGWGARDCDRMLIDATIGGHIAIADLALEWGATELEKMAQVAAEHGHWELLKLAWRRGARRFGEMAKSAARCGHGAILDKIRWWAAAELAASVDIENWVLEGATEGGHDAIVDDALEPGADYERMFIAAAKGGHVELARRARGLAAATPTPIADYTDALYAAAANNHRGFIDYLWSVCGATDPEPILEGATIAGLPRMAAYARSLGARNFGDMLFNSAICDNVEMAKLARAWGAADFNTMLATASYAGSFRVAKLARAWGATDVNRALVAAARANSIEMVSLIKSWGANAFRNAMESAITDHKLGNLVVLLEWWHPNSGWLLLQTAYAGFTEGARLALRRGSISPEDRSRAHNLARAGGYPEIAKLLAAAADPDALD